VNPRESQPWRAPRLPVRTRHPAPGPGRRPPRALLGDDLPVIVVGECGSTTVTLGVEDRGAAVEGRRCCDRGCRAVRASLAALQIERAATPRVAAWSRASNGALVARRGSPGPPLSEPRPYAPRPGFAAPRIAAGLVEGRTGSRAALIRDAETLSVESAVKQGDRIVAHSGIRGSGAVTIQQRVIASYPLSRAAFFFFFAAAGLARFTEVFFVLLLAGLLFSTFFFSSASSTHAGA
jgi:hypothetical protein